MGTPILKRDSSTEKITDRLDLRAEIARKTIHLSSISIALIYSQISRSLALLLLVPLFAGFFLIDLLKNISKPVSAWYHRSFGGMLRHHELEQTRVHLNGATCITLAALLLVFFFPKVIAVTAFSMVAFSDTMAALAGKTFGRHRFGHKSLEGSAAFLVTSLVIIGVVPNLKIQAGITMAVVATIAEAFEIRVANMKIDDNLTIPLAAAISGMIFYSLFFPEQLASLHSCR